jgi:hypothetical protein
MKNNNMITILNLVENDDGSATIQYDPSKEFVDFYMKTKHVKKFTTKGLNKFLLELLTKAAKSEVDKMKPDDYKLVEDIKEEQ